jgi:hypothetical protein
VWWARATRPRPFAPGGSPSTLPAIPPLFYFAKQLLQGLSSDGVGDRIGARKPLDLRIVVNGDDVDTQLGGQLLLTAAHTGQHLSAARSGGKDRRAPDAAEGAGNKDYLAGARPHRFVD